MRVPIAWVKQYLDFDLPPSNELAEVIGNQLGAIEEVIDQNAKYQGIFIVRVVKCDPHPNADKLKVCLIDDGGKAEHIERNSDGQVQVVCGAPNVHADMFVAWLPPGATVPSSLGSDNEPFVLEAREIRDVVSNGMLASAKELAIGDNHEGILELDGEIKPGDDFASIYKLNDVIFDIENKMFTHRPDCFGILGVAREIAGILGHKFTSPEEYKIQPTTVSSSDQLTAKDSIPEKVPRLVVQVINNVQIAPSPVWLQAELSQAGVRPINNVVDITNYYMLLTGQPLHAYDLKKVQALSSSGPVLEARAAKKGEQLELLSGKTIELREEDIVISTDKVAIGLGGIMGGSQTEVDNDTTDIILECANFDMYVSRRSAMAHGIFTDAFTRFSKHQSPLQNARVAKMASDALAKLAGGKPGDMIDLNHVDSGANERDSLYPPVKVTADFINARLGLQLEASAIKTLLENVEFVVEGDQELAVKAPFWRTDIELKEDMVEEVGRLYGYDKLPIVLPMRNLTPAESDSLIIGKQQIRRRLVLSGANEVLNYSFVDEKTLTRAGQNPSKAYQIANALSPSLQHYRLSLIPSLLEKIRPNLKAGYDQFALFEIGKSHSLDNKLDDDGLPKEFQVTALVLTAAEKLKVPGSAYYEAKLFLEELADAELEYKPLGAAAEQDVAKPFDKNRSALVNVKGGEFLGIIGEFKPSVTRNFKLPQHSAGFEADSAVLSKLLKKTKTYTALPIFPKLIQDISLKVPAELPYAELHEKVKDAIKQRQPDNTWFKLSPRDIFQADSDTTHKNVTFRLQIASYEKTLTDREVNTLLDEVASMLKSEVNVERI